MKVVLSFILFFFVSQQLNAAVKVCQNTEQFFKYLEVVKEGTQVKEIKIRKGLFELPAIKAYSLPSPFAHYDRETIRQIEQLLPQDLHDVFKDAITNARDMNRDEIAKIVATALNQVENQVTQLSHIFSTIVVLDDTEFFYRRALVNGLLEQGEGLLQDSLPQGIANNVGFFVFNKVINWILERQQYYQNMILDNLENVELGFSPIEKQKILSSIYESRIKWYEVFRHRKAQEHWLDFGTESFLKQKQTADKNLNKYFASAESAERLDYGFATITNKGERNIMHLLVPIGYLIDQPALAYNYENPKKVLIFRVTVEAARFGLVFVPPAASIPASLLSDYLSSLYVPQKRAEGALVGATWRTCDELLMNDLVRQSLNPILIRDFGVDWY